MLISFVNKRRGGSGDTDPQLSKTKLPQHRSSFPKYMYFTLEIYCIDHDIDVTFTTIMFVEAMETKGYFQSSRGIHVC